MKNPAPRPVSFPGPGLASTRARPKQGWLRAIRESQGLSRRIVAQRLRVSDAAVRDYEVAEASDTISLGTLRRVARALGCELVLAVVPKPPRSTARRDPGHGADDPPPSPQSPPRTDESPVATSVAPDTDELASHLK